MRTILNLSMQTKRGACFCRTPKRFSAQTQIKTFPRGYLPNLYYEPQLQLVGRRQSIVCNNGTRGTFSLNSLFVLLDPSHKASKWRTLFSIVLPWKAMSHSQSMNYHHVPVVNIKRNPNNLMYRRKTKDVFEALDSSELSFRLRGDMIRSDNGVKGRWKHR